MDKALNVAKAKAAETGKRVPLPSRYTETMKVWANTDGKTLHAELSTEPVQLEVPGKDGKKSWQPVDTSIVARADGTLAAKLVKTPLAFGGEGATTLVTAKDKDGTVAVGWDGKLPKPTVDGNTITYRDAVAKGADLVLTACPNGFTQNVVLRTRPQEPVKVSLPVTLPKGKTYSKADDGRPQLKSAQGVAETAPLATQAIDAKAAEAPDQGKLGKVEASVTTDASGRSSLVLTPDAAFLADPSVTYPVVVPMSGEWIGAGDSSDTFVSSVQYPNSATLFTWLRAGKSADGELWRTYLRYVINGTDLDYATIHDADLRFWNYHASGCGTNVGVGIVARRLTSAYHYSTLTWANQPSSTGTNAVVAPGGYSATLSGCSGSGELYHSIQHIVQEWANGTADHGLMIRAATEGAAGANWRQYRSDQYTGGDGRGPVLFIDYEPAPRASIAFSTLNKFSTLPTYEEAVALQDYQSDVNETGPVKEAFATVIQGARGQNDAVEADKVGTDQIDVPEGGGSGGEETQPPSLIGVTPEPGATGVPAETTVSATYSEIVVGAQIVLRAPDGTPVEGATTFDGTGTAVTFTPAQPLTPGTTYSATASDAQDIWDNVADDYTWSFTTAGADTTPPVVIARNPNADATDAPVGTTVSATFSEPVTDTRIVVEDANGTAVAGGVTVTGTVATFTPAEPLAVNTAYHVEVTGAKDGAGNVMTPVTWTFTTATAPPADTAPPAVVSATPSSGATGVAVGTAVTVTFSEPVHSAVLTLKGAAGATIAGTATMNGAATTLTFTPAQPLAAGVLHTVGISGASDAAGNVMVPSTWTFTTATPPPTQPVNPNPFFETTIEPWTSFWDVDVLSRSTARAHQGTASAKFVPEEDTWGYAIEEFPLTGGGGDYRLSGWFYLSVPDPFDYGFDYGVEWYDADWEMLSTDNLTGTPTTGQWQQVSGIVTAPAGTAYAIVNVGVGTTIFMDELTLTPVTGAAAAQTAKQPAPQRVRRGEVLSLHDRDQGRTIAKERASSTRAAVRASSGGFTYNHASLEECIAAHNATGQQPADGKPASASLLVRPYSMCWSSWYYVMDFIWAGTRGGWVRKALKNGAKADALEFRATWVINTYLGTADGTGVVGGGGYRPQEMSVWTRISEITAYDGNWATNEENQRVLELTVTPSGSAGSTCTPTAGTDVDRDDTIAEWKADGDDSFRYVMGDTDNDRVDVCTFRPILRDVHQEWAIKPLRLWNQIAYDNSSGQVKGKWIGGGDPSDNDPQELPYIPHVRCDWLHLGASTSQESARAMAAPNEPTGHKGGCIHTLAKRIFTMKESRDNPNFGEVIKHIKEARNQSTNKGTFPPLRDGENYGNPLSPPLKGSSGTEKPKVMRGDWLAPHLTEAAKPFIKATDEQEKNNRKVFSLNPKDNPPKGLFEAEGKTYQGSWCKYYWEGVYATAPKPTSANVHCDEFPWAKTTQGAANANGHFSIRAISAAHNLSHGGTMGAWYTKRRVIPGDSFWYEIIP
ncbi:Ig-like domain-containing protein [Streptosporangium sp. OZ121]|uniref:Ig-like domain-containing protein n=1 Tax=Streptosporangium sp. OZ121 TaxID=3444183 RepID=UPI003F7AD3A9